MPLTLDRLASERDFHDHQAAARSHDLRSHSDWWVDDNAYLDHESWIRPAFDTLTQHLHSLAGRRLLDLGCGHGMMAVVLARRGAHVTAVDLSGGYLREAQQRAVVNGVNVACVCADGERLPFADASFDGIWGNAILHHLDPARAAAELRRVLRPGGVAVFCEPWAGNPLIEAARRWLPYPGKARTRDEQPLTPGMLRTFQTAWPGVEVRGFQFLAAVRRFGLKGRWLDRVHAIDRRLLTACPALERWARYVVLTVRFWGERGASAP
jgi:SAM-dependent methyltransferase